MPVFDEMICVALFSFVNHTNRWKVVLRGPNGLWENKLVKVIHLLSFYRCIGAHQASILEYVTENTKQMLTNHATSIYGFNKEPITMQKLALVLQFLACFMISQPLKVEFVYHLFKKIKVFKKRKVNCVLHFLPGHRNKVGPIERQWIFILARSVAKFQTESKSLSP